MKRHAEALLQPVQTKPLTLVGKTPRRKIGGGQRRQAAAAGQQEHQEYLVFHGLQRIEACKNLSRHDARQGHDAGCRHLIDDRQQTAADSFPHQRRDCFAIAFAERQPRFDRLPFAPDGAIA